MPNHTAPPTLRSSLDHAPMATTAPLKADNRGRADDHNTSPHPRAQSGPTVRMTGHLQPAPHRFAYGTPTLKAIAAPTICRVCSTPIRSQRHSAPLRATTAASLRDRRRPGQISPAATHTETNPPVTFLVQPPAPAALMPARATPPGGPPRDR